VKALVRAVEIYDKSAVAHVELGLLYRTAGKTREAIEHFHKALEADPEEERIHNYLASAYRSTGASEKAEYHLKLFRKLSITGELRRARFKQRRAPL
jgi:Tfp pilus assembly protein PilF